MKSKALAGSALAALMGVGVLAGSVIGNNSASAQTPAATPSPTVTAPGTTPAAPIDPSTTLPGDRGGFGGGRGHGGRDGGIFGGAATADGATHSITNATDSIAAANSDLTYATGKMDTAQVQEWLDGAASLLKSAEAANAASQYGQSNAYANAASELARAADSVMAKALGAANLPSYADRPQHGDKDLGTAAASITQAQASRILAETYNNLTAKSAAINGASNASEAAPYLADAQNAYKAAYDAYGAGNYADAVYSAHLAGQLGHVASSIASASTAPANADTLVTVPAPNF